jgi:hypothetical protein
MAYRSQAERKNLSITVPMVQVDATGCVDASPGGPVLDVSSPKALSSPLKQSLQQQQRRNNLAAVEAQQRRRRSCHGTLAEQHSPGWQLKQSWTLDSKQADGTPCNSIAPTYTNATNTTICISSSSSSKKQDAAGSSSKHDQQVQPAQAVTAATAAAPMQQRQQAAADADVSVHAARPRSPFAAPDVQACTCHMRSGKQGCEVHASRMVYTGAGPGTSSSNSNTSSSSSSDGSSKKVEKVRQKARKLAFKLWQGMSLACWHPSATVPGIGDAYVMTK